MASNLVTLLFLEEHRSKRSRPLCETEWNDREASRRKSIFCSSSRMCKEIRGRNKGRGWKIDGTTWNSFDFDCFRRTFNATAAKVEPRFLLRRKRLLSLLFIYFFSPFHFSPTEKSITIISSVWIVVEHVWKLFLFEKERYNYSFFSFTSMKIFDPFSLFSSPLPLPPLFEERD